MCPAGVRIESYRHRRAHPEGCRPGRAYLQSGAWHSPHDTRRQRESARRIREVLSASPMKLGVLVFNLGGPESLRDVKPFLYRLFSDPEIIRIKWSPLRKAVADMIAAARRKGSEGYYRWIGGGAPLRRLTEEQAAALEGGLMA